MSPIAINVPADLADYIADCIEVGNEGNDKTRETDYRRTLGLIEQIRGFSAAHKVLDPIAERTPAGQKTSLQEAVAILPLPRKDGGRVAAGQRRPA